MSELTGSRRFEREPVPPPPSKAPGARIRAGARVVDPAGNLVGWLDRWGNPQPVKKGARP